MCGLPGRSTCPCATSPRAPGVYLLDKIRINLKAWNAEQFCRIEVFTHVSIHKKCLGKRLV